jgi:addiction module HigA family antidote
MSASKLAMELRVPANRITAIVNGQRGVTGDTALRLAKFFGNTSKFWMNLQAHYELEVAEAKHGEEIEITVSSLV